MLIYRLFLVIDVAVAAVVVYFFVVGLGDGTVSSRNGAMWAGLLAAVAVVPAGGMILQAKGYRGAAIALLAIMAVPGFLAGLFVLSLIVLQPRWN